MSGTQRGGHRRPRWHAAVNPICPAGGALSPCTAASQARRSRQAEPKASSRTQGRHEETGLSSFTCLHRDKALVPARQPPGFAHGRGSVPLRGTRRCPEPLPGAWCGSRPALQQPRRTCTGLSPAATRPIKREPKRARPATPLAPREPGSSVLGNRAEVPARPHVPEAEAAGDLPGPGAVQKG